MRRVTPADGAGWTRDAVLDLFDAEDDAGAERRLRQAAFDRLVARAPDDEEAGAGRAKVVFRPVALKRRAKDDRVGAKPWFRAAVDRDPDRSIIACSSRPGDKEGIGHGW
jgi:hypothetical protein